MRKEKRSLNRGLLKLLRKVHDVLMKEEQLQGQTRRYLQRRMSTAKVLEQQEGKFNEGIKPKHRIVSLDKPYLRPIVRGKEVKKVEFGAKVHKVQIDGISFIEHLSFDAFNEGTRLVKTIQLSQTLMHTQTKVVGADGIYATNSNRTYVTNKGIKTDFKRKGRKSKHHPQFEILHKAITRERATRLEGSFGTDKEHFLLNRIKARSELTEKLWIFFGIHTSNALKIGRRMSQIGAKAA
jgi:D-Tyr-tRNAtyr deacylase